MKQIRSSTVLMSIALFALLFALTGCATRIDKIATALTPPKDPGIVDMDISGRGIVVKYHRDTSIGGARSNAGSAVVITPETTLKIQTVK